MRRGHHPATGQMHLAPAPGPAGRRARRTGLSPILASALAIILVGVGVVTASEPGPGSVDFFESKVRPVLVEHCYSCHSAQAKQLKGGLRLDTVEGIRKGGDIGPSLDAVNPEESLLIQAVRHTDEQLKMPPKAKLPLGVIDVLERWVKAGAAMPEPSSARTASQTKARKAADFVEGAKHWAFRPIRRQEQPSVRDRTWATSPIDAFVLARLEAAGLSPSPPADRRTLLRRAYFDLIGLPPTAEEIAAFERDRTDDAFARVVDRLLASPRYGERWGRHWLDVARYADTKDGVLMFGDDRLRPYAYTYRDYVIRAFNDDLPFDRFIHEQLAADAIAPADEPWRLAALGFLTLGRMFDNNIHDQIDDKIDTVSRGLLALTVACARCHDHKYDPIPSEDYYSLYGVFASSEAPMELPLTERLEKMPECAEFEKQAGAKRAELRKFLDEQFALLSETARQRAGDYLYHAATTEADPLETAIFFMSLSPEELRPQVTARWRRYLKQRAVADDPVFGPWYDLSQLSPADFAAEASSVLARWSTRPQGTERGSLNPLIATAMARTSIKTRSDAAKMYADLLRRVYDESKKLKSGTGPEDAPRRQILAIVGGHESPSYFPKGQTWAYMSRGEKDEFGKKQTELDRMVAKAATAAPRAMALVDAAEPYEPRVFVRGNPSQPGERVPRQFLGILAGKDRAPFTHGSGRLDLARAITAADNPLTSRVLVNRVWMHHFGEPLVSTPSDFGTRSTPPSHPELLDDLAARFVSGGWSLKTLHRLIVLSSTYRQASVDRPECRKVDPENRLLWRANRRRLDLEAMRDSLLFTSGRLELKMLGKPVDAVNDARTTRRTVYGLVDRQSLPSVYRAFDFASPDLSTDRRPRTTVPQQALFSMNSPLVVEQVRAIAARPEVASSETDEARVQALYRLVLARDPAAEELDTARRFLGGERTAEKGGLDRLQQLAQVLLMTNEFLFVD